MIHKTTINAVHDNDLMRLLGNLGLSEKLKAGELKCKFTKAIITFDNLYSIFPEGDTIKLVCDSPDAIKLFAEYLNDLKK